MAHDFERFPELTNSQMELYYFDSPHKQITEDFSALCVKVHDGDTITVRWQDRDFDFPVRFSGINAPELSEGGDKSGDWLRQRIEGKNIDVIIDPTNRVGKFGRILGKVMHGGMDLSEEMVLLNLAHPFEQKDEGEIPTLDRVLAS